MTILINLRHLPGLCCATYEQSSLHSLVGNPVFLVHQIQRLHLRDIILVRNKHDRALTMYIHGPG